MLKSEIESNENFSLLIQAGHPGRLTLKQGKEAKAAIQHLQKGMEKAGEIRKKSCS